MCAGASTSRNEASLYLTNRDEDLLQSLAERFRLVTPELVSRLWTTSPSYACRRLGRLVDASLLTRASVITHPLLELVSPVVTWNPGQAAPDFSAVSYRLKSRWTSSVRPTTVYFATRRLVQLLGGAGGTLDYPLQVTHDLHVAALYIRLRAQSPERAHMWQGEDRLRQGRKKGRGKVCDAALVEVRPSGRECMVQAIEFGGSYAAERIRAFHRVMENRRLPYELW